MSLEKKKRQGNRPAARKVTATWGKRKRQPCPKSYPLCSFRKVRASHTRARSVAVGQFRLAQVAWQDLQPPAPFAIKIDGNSDRSARRTIRVGRIAARARHSRRTAATRLRPNPPTISVNLADPAGAAAAVAMRLGAAHAWFIPLVGQHVGIAVYDRF